MDKSGYFDSFAFGNTWFVGWNVVCVTFPLAVESGFFCLFVCFCWIHSAVGSGCTHSLYDIV